MTSSTSDLRLKDALLRYHFKIDPETLTDQEWATLVKDLEWIRDQERKQGERNINSLFGKK